MHIEAIREGEGRGNERFYIVTDVEIDHSRGCANPNTFFFQCRVCNRPIKIRMGCGKRFDYFCPSCAKQWRNKTFKRYFKAVSFFKKPKFLTLTLKKTPSATRSTDRLKKLWEMKKYLFKRLKERGYPVTKWVGVIEPPNHIHMIVDCGYIPRDEISELWEEITGDSYIVDIRQINVQGDIRKVAAYITKYISKASSWEGINLDLLEGFHLCGSWGLPPKSLGKPVCPCGTLHKLMRLSREDYVAECWIPNECSADYLREHYGLYISELE